MASRKALMSSGAAALLTSAALVLWHLGRRTQRMENELEDQRHLATLGGMSAVLAHEIRNPLAALKGHAQLLAEKIEDPRAGERVQRVLDEALRLEALTNDLLDFARSGAMRPAATSRAPARASGRSRTWPPSRSPTRGPPARRPTSTRSRRRSTTSSRARCRPRSTSSSSRRPRARCCAARWARGHAEEPQ
jgi:two-component system sensor histidine kinase HydH